MKKLQLKTEVTINIPEHLIIIEKVEYERIQQEEMVGRYWGMKDLEERTGMKSQWLKENVLYIPKFKQQLEKFAYYPNSQGEKWSFQATKMAKFLEDNFYKIFNP